MRVRSDGAIVRLGSLVSVSCVGTVGIVREVTYGGDELGVWVSNGAWVFMHSGGGRRIGMWCYRCEMEVMVW